MKKSIVRRSYVFLMIMSFMCFLQMAGQAHAAAPGTVPPGNSDEPAQASANSIEPFVTEFGKISVSIDGLGTASPGTIQVDKPAGATVRKAFMAAASTGGSGRTLADGDVTIDGDDVSWNLVTSIPSSFSSSNSLADVTALVKTKIDAAPAGLIDFQIDEISPGSIDGEILAVILNDPNQTTENTVVLLFGAQNVDGDNFSVGTAEPIDKSDPNLVIEMSLGISFGYQKQNTQQYSQIDVNGARLTTSAGGEDDGENITTAFNGELITVGGIGDSSDNPPDPFATPSGDPRIDDELYNLLPFVNSSDTSILVNTLNPSNDDNIFFASFFFGASSAIVGEGILLEPATATNAVSTPHTVTATVQDDDGNPVEGREVTFEVLSGPHAGTVGLGTTDSDGEASFTYTGASAGTDILAASMVDSSGTEVSSNEVTSIWTDLLPGKAVLISPNGDITNSSPTFIWNAVANADQYLLWVQFDDTRERFSKWYTSDAAGCDDGICEINPTATSLVGAASLYGDISYTWWVDTWNSAGLGPWSDPMNYRVLMSDAPGATTPTAPIGISGNSQPTFEWIPVAGATWYKIQAWETGAPDFTLDQWYRDIDGMCTATACSVTPDILLPPSNYRWRIRAWNNAGLGPWSSIITFDSGE